jgi:two-component system, cell cycle response regulator DivK
VLLERKGYAVVSAGDGFEAVDVAIHTLPDLILIDLDLPGLDGLAVTAELRLHPGLEKTPIIVISGHDPESYRAAAMNAGCNDYLMKPIDFSVLDKVLHENIPQRFEHSARLETPLRQDENDQVGCQTKPDEAIRFPPADF